MLAIRNRTPFAAAIVPGLDREGYDTATLIVKGTFEIAAGRPPRLADEQQPILHADEHHGEPGASSVRRESDACPRKPGADVVLVGHAWSRRRVESLDVALAVGPARKTVRVFGERRWFRAVGGWAISDPVPFERMPLVYERAYGGADNTGDPDPAKHAMERRNPVGRGFEVGRDARDLEGLPLPNLEDPRALIYTPDDRPAPAGFGFIGRGWLPRASYAGTYDDAWRAERCPFLPDDFDERYFHGAHPDLVLPAPLRGGELCTVTNASEQGDLRFQVPAAGVAATARVRGAPVELSPRIDTLILEPDERRLTLTWRATFRCPRSFLYIDDVLIREVAA